MKFRNIFWGVVLIFLGVLFILSNLNIIYFDWVYLWRLWPVILVLWGVSILPAHNLIKLGLTLLVLGGTVVFMVDQTVEWDDRNEFRIEKWEDYDRFPIEQTFTIPYDDSIKFAALNLELAAGSFVIDEPSDLLIDFNKQGTKAKYSYVLKRMEDRANINIERDEVKIVTGRSNHKVNLKLNDEPVWEFNIDAGAASVDFDLTKFKVNKLDLDGGAGSFYIRLGDLNPETLLNIDAGASSIEIEIPESSGCDLMINSVLSGKSINGFEKLERGHYRTENFNDSIPKIFIDIEAAVSSYSITRY